MASIATRMSSSQPVSNKDMVILLEDMRLDLVALRAAVVAITAKLDLDAGVTDANYASLTNPAALRTVA